MFKRKLVRYLLAGLAGVLLVVGLLVAANLAGNQARSRGPELPTPVVTAADKLPDADGMEKLAREDPIAFLENCIRRYRREVEGYTLVMQKQERENGKLQPVEVVAARYRETPKSIFLRWLEGAGKADRVLFVEGENGGKALARPKNALARRLLGDVVERDQDSADFASLMRFGLKRNNERTLAVWKAARDKGPLTVEYLGTVPLEQAGDRVCYKLRYTSADPQEKGATDMVVYVDQETWLQTGTILKDKEGALIGAFYFRDIRLNPELKAEEFRREALTSE